MRDAGAELYPKRMTSTERESLDVDVLTELRLRTDSRRKTYNMVTGPFGIEASTIASALRVDTLRVAAALKRLKRHGYADYCDFGKTWHSRQIRHSATVIALKPRKPANETICKCCGAAGHSRLECIFWKV